MMKIEEIKSLMRMMSEYEVTEFRIEAEGCNLSIARGNSVPAALPPIAVTPATHIQPAAVAPIAEPPQTAAKTANIETIDSPLVGSFYRSASPDAKPFVSVGDKVTPDTVVCIIEAMKVMNEVKAEKTGVVREVLIENGHPVEYGQPLFTLE